MKKQKVLLFLMAVSFIVNTVMLVKFAILTGSTLTGSGSVWEILPMFFVEVASLYIFVLVVGVSSYVGFIASYRSVKIAANPVIKRISTVSLWFHSIVIVFMVGVLAIGWGASFLEIWL